MRDGERGRRAREGRKEEGKDKEGEKGGAFIFSPMCLNKVSICLASTSSLIL